MPLTEKHRLRFTIAWVALFYLLAAYKWWQGMWLYQFDPFFFKIRFDGISWLLMQTGFHQWMMHKPLAQIIFDIAFYGMPLVYLIVYGFKKQRAAQQVAVAWCIINWIYVLLYTLYPTNSIEAHTPWLLFPILFAAVNLRSFYFLLRGLRYFFVFFFFSAGVWKLVNGGAFEPAQMSGILLAQHATFLVSDPMHWQSRFIYMLIEMPIAGFLLYWAATLIELFFVVGFFSRRFDKLLIVLFVLFLMFDYLVMRIPYFEVSPYLLTLLYSPYGLPEEDDKEGALSRNHSS
jgi:hypothetical protein